MNELCPMPGCRVERVARDGPDLLHIAARGTQPGGRCPDCGRASRAVHSRYRRHPVDLPSLGSRVRVALVVRRFYCRTPSCARRTFAERLPELVAPRARRTLRLAETQGRVGAALGGEAGAGLLSRLAMPASADTVLRLVRQLPLPEPDPARVVAVDDWALRKGRTYGTIVVDLERRRVLDLLPDRTAETLAGWLRARPGIEVVARDRSTEYARAIALGAPEATQVSDRWHLLANMRQVLERWLAGAQARLRRLPVLPGPDAPADTRQRSGRRTGPFPRSAAEMRARAGRRERRIALYKEVRRRRAAGETLLAIGRTVGLAVNTVRKYAAAESFPVAERQRPWPSILDPYLAHLRARFAEGCNSPRVLWREVRAMGFPGTDKQVQRWLAQHRSALAAPPAGPDRPPALPPATQLAWLLIQPPAALSADDASTTARVEQDGEAAGVAALARRFTALVRGCGVRQKPDPATALAALEVWLADARACGVRTVETFAAGLEQDGAAVRAALTTPWSSGQAEGQITRLKLIKRQSYGRAGFDLLRRRVLIAA